MDWSIILPILYTAVCAAANGYVSYLKVATSESFDVAKLWKTILMAAGVAVVGSIFGLEENVIIASPLYTFIGVLLENAVKAVSRKIKTKENQ